MQDSKEEKTMKTKAYVIDLDGTLAENQVRATSNMKHWKDYWPLYEHIPEDKVNEWCKELIWDVGTSREIIILTGRPRYVRKLTEDWLVDNNIPIDELIMMPENYPEEKTDTDFKREKIRILKEKYDIVLAIDDREENCKMFKEEGVSSLLVR